MSPYPQTEHEVKQKLIVALDVPTVAEARHLARELEGVVGALKIGSQLFTSAGPDLVRELVRQRQRVFLDLKFHDIPNTVAAAAVEATRLGVFMFNIHAAGGSEMMMQTRDAVMTVSAKEGLEKPLIIAVTVLTSTGDAALNSIGVASSADEQVKRLAMLTDKARLDGVVASPREVELIRSVVSNDNFVVVTPGIRPANVSLDDQKRTTTPAEAILAGADYLVVGRPITNASNPRGAAEAIVCEMETAGQPGTRCPGTIRSL
jgi:orotidine-5'-phosphate decarboxylase